MAVEIALRVGSNPSPTGWRDGMPVAAWPAGLSWTAAEVNQWVNNGTEPANFSQLSSDKQQEWRRWRKIADYCLNSWTNAKNAAKLYFGVSGNPTPKQEEEVTEIRQSILDTETNVTTYGFLDAYWGFGDMLSYAIMSMDVSAAKVREFLSAPIDPNQPVFSPRVTFSRRLAIVDWRNLPGITAGVISTIEDPNQILQPSTFRGTTFSAAQVLAVTTILNDPSEVPPAV